MKKTGIYLSKYAFAPRSFGRAARIFFFCLSVLLLSSSFAAAQKRDNLTPQEDEIVREVQEADLRMEIYAKVIDRRLAALSGGNLPQSKKAEKDAEKWGDLRRGTRVELLSDIEKTLQEAVNKINDIAERDAKNPLFPKAVRTLARDCSRWLPTFKTLQESAAEERERALLAATIDLANQVIEASANVPKEETKKKKT